MPEDSSVDSCIYTKSTDLYSVASDAKYAKVNQNELTNVLVDTVSVSRAAEPITEELCNRSGRFFT